jgi:hypothetical protein
MSKEIKMKRNLSTLSSVLFILLATSCAPSKMFVRTNDSYQTRISKSERVGIINDVCLELDPLFKKDYVLLDDSKVAAILMAEEAKRSLEMKGYAVNFIESPFVGSFFASDDSFRVADEKGGVIWKIKPPLYFEDSVSTDEVYVSSLLGVFNEVFLTMAGNNEPIFATNPDLRNSLQIIADRTGDDKILFMIGNGTIVPVGKSILEGVTIGLATALLTFGTFTYYFYDVSYMDSYLALIDLNTGDLLWTNSMRLTDSDPSCEQFYSQIWSKNLLYYYPVKEGRVLEKL